MGAIIEYYQGITPQNMIVHSFSNADGINPLGSLIQASDGNLYGLTSGGGANGAGTIFKYNITGSMFTKLQDLDSNVNGAFPLGSFYEASDGNLYATTSSGGSGSNNNGTIIKYNISSNTLTDVHDFAGQTSDGASPQSNLTGANGILYGTTIAGGTNNLGTLFSYTLSNGNEATVLNFDGSTYGQAPFGSPVFANNGLIYGTTTAGGSATINDGTLYSYNPSNLGSSNVYNFSATVPTGNVPKSDLIMGTDGNVYGTTSEVAGGLGGGNVGIFQLVPSTSTMTNIYNFPDNTAIPYGGVIQGSDGLLYGMTSTGGQNNAGTIYSYSVAGSSFNTLINLSSGVTGSMPFGRLVQVNLNTGINDISSVALSVYPNPASTQLNIQGIKFERDAVVIITDIMGKKIVVGNQISPTKIGVNIQSLDAGAYIVEVIQQGQSYTGKFMKLN